MQARRPWGCRGAMAPPDFGRLVNPISTKGGRLCPSNSTGTPDFHTFRRPCMHGAPCVLVAAIRKFNSFFFSFFSPVFLISHNKYWNHFWRSIFVLYNPLCSRHFLHFHTTYLWMKVWKWEYVFLHNWFYPILALESWKRLFIRMPIDRFDWYCTMAHCSYLNIYISRNKVWELEKYTKL